MKQTLVALIFLFGLSTPTPAPTGVPIGVTTSNNVAYDACPDAKYIDDKDIAWACKNCECIPYYAELDTPDNDRGYCGIGLFETGEWDPLYFVCRRHDAMFNYQKTHDGKVQESIIKTQAHFTIDAGKKALYGLYAIGAFLVYVPLVWLVGSPIQLYRRWKGNKD